MQKIVELTKGVGKVLADDRSSSLSSLDEDYHKDMIVELHPHRGASITSVFPVLQYFRDNRASIADMSKVKESFHQIRKNVSQRLSFNAIKNRTRSSNPYQEDSDEEQKKEKEKPTLIGNIKGFKN